MGNTASSWDHSCAHMQSKSPSRSVGWMTQRSGSRKPVCKLEIIPKGNLSLLFYSSDLWVPGSCLLLCGVCMYMCVHRIMLPFICVLLSRVLLLYTALLLCVYHREGLPPHKLTPTPGSVPLTYPCSLPLFPCRHQFSIHGAWIRMD